MLSQEDKVADAKGSSALKALKTSGWLGFATGQRLPSVEDNVNSGQPVSPAYSALQRAAQASVSSDMVADWLRQF